MNVCSIVVASSDAERRGEVRSALELEGHEVAEAWTAPQTIRHACTGPRHLLVMDSAVDGITAEDLCRKIRPQSKLGIIVWGGKPGIPAIDALNAGADDYIPAPCVLVELQARARAILRRVARAVDRPPIVLGDRQVDLRSHEIRGPGNGVNHLTPKEAVVLQHLIACMNAPKSAQALAQAIWNRDGSGDLEYVRVVIRQLRRKIEPDPASPRYILTEPSAGYRFQMPSEVAAERVSNR
jgi:two-component system KDP operon response regulator KdpE